MKKRILTVLTAGLIIVLVGATPAVAEPALDSPGAAANWGWIGDGPMTMFIRPNLETVYSEYEVTVQQHPIQHISMHIVGTSSQLLVRGQFFYTDAGHTTAYEPAYSGFFGPWADKETLAQGYGSLVLPPNNINPPNPTDEYVTVYYMLYGKVTSE